MPADSVRVQSVDRAVDLLLALAAASPAEATAPALARACGLNRATAWRLLKTLQIRGLVTVDDATGRYAIGLTAVELGNAAGPDALIAVARPVLERTCALTGETASLAVPDVDGLTYVDEVTPAAVVTASWLGRSVPVHATSTGKALLAFLPPEQVRRVLDGALTSFTGTTITDPAGAGRRTGRDPGPRVRGVRRGAGVVAVRGVGTGARPDRAAVGGAEHLGAAGPGAAGAVRRAGRGGGAGSGRGGRDPGRGRRRGTRGGLTGAMISGQC